VASTDSDTPGSEHRINAVNRHSDTDTVDPTTPTSYIVLLQSMLLVLKLTHLANSVPRHADNAKAAVSKLWGTLRELSNSLAKQDCASSNAQASPSSASLLTEQGSALKTEEESQVSIVLVRLVMPVLLHTVQHESTEFDIARKMLLALMPTSRKAVYQAVAAEIIKSGTASLCCLATKCMCSTSGLHLGRSGRACCSAA